MRGCLGDCGAIPNPIPGRLIDHRFDTHGRIVRAPPNGTLILGCRGDGRGANMPLFPVGSWKFFVGAAMGYAGFW